MEKILLKQLEVQLLPGGKSEIAKKASVSIHTVIRFFNGKSNNKKVLLATHQYLKEVKESRNELEQSVINA